LTERSSPIGRKEFVMRRTYASIAVFTAVCTVCLAAWQAKRSAAQSSVIAKDNLEKSRMPALPISQVVLFNSGVGYFQREGQVDGNVRCELAFPASDVNDLLKSLVLQDRNGGQISTVYYDSSEPIDRTLKSFALDLTSNPSFGELLNQARGEKVEVTMQASASSSPGTLTGVIVGMEARRGTAAEGEIELLNVLCTEGLRNLPLPQVQRVRFLNPVLENELRRALEMLATGHDTQKKAVTFSFRGAGKRSVRVGYVVENPIWKTSYRLMLDQENKPHLQGWAIVENTSDEDWDNVRMVLMSGKPLSFQMDLYQPINVPRPTVEPELFASLRPPAYSGAIVSNRGQGNNLGVGGGALGFGGGFGGGHPGALGGGLGALGGLGGMPGPSANMVQREPFVNRYQRMQRSQGRNAPPDDDMAEPGRRLTYQEMQHRLKEQRDANESAKKVGSSVAAIDPAQGVATVASVRAVGDNYRYLIDERVTLPRQKSALLPIINEKVAATRVSIFNESVLSPFPLLGLRFKNASGFHLMQGPIAVYEGGTFAGDSRILDLEPGEERLLAYGIDLGTEVAATPGRSSKQLKAAQIAKGVLQLTYVERETKQYAVKNRSEHDRLLEIEHPVRRDWRLLTPTSPLERSRDLYRFQLAVPRGKNAELEVTEEKILPGEGYLQSFGESTIRMLLASEIVKPQLKEALKKSLSLAATVADTHRETVDLEEQLKSITTEQARLRANLEKLPPTSAAYKRYLEKFDSQETKIEKLQAQIKQKQEKERQDRKLYEDYVISLTID
jgi:hypothetical protein